MLSSWTDCCSCLPQTWIFAIMSFLAFCIANALRSVLSITITEMVFPMHVVANQSHGRCFDPPERALENDESIGHIRYDWNEYTQGLILSSFYWGYGPTQLIFGSMAERWGGKYFLGQAIFIPSLLTFLTPLAITMGGSTALIVLRTLMGVSSSAMYPSISTMISQFTTPANRTRFGTFICAGFILGQVFGTVIPTLIIKYTATATVFYFFGMLGMLWFPFWVVLVPQKTLPERTPPAPYRHIFRSKPFWAFVIGLFGCDWAYFTMASDLPKYMSSIVGLPIEQNGYLSALPYLGMWLNATLSSWFIDWIIARELMTRTNIKKLFTVVAAVGSSVFILLATSTYAGCNQFVVVAFFVTSMVLMGSAYPTIMMNNLDLSPNYAGSLISISNSIAALGGVLAPYLVGLMTNGTTDDSTPIDEWRKVFWIGFVIAVSSSCFVILYASSDVQYWNDLSFDRDSNKMRRKKKKDVNSENI